MSDWVIGVDLGGTKIEIGLVSPDNQIVGRRRIPTQAADGPVRVVERIAQVVEELTALLPSGKAIAALGICSPGPVDHETGTLIDPPNLAGLHNTPLRQLLAERLRVVVSLEHDAKAAALGEFHYGVGRGERSMVYIVVGTGVGGAIISDGQLLRGPDNSAGEIGHVTLDRNGEICSCGSRGCVETFVAGPWLARRYQWACERAGHPTSSDGAFTGEQVVSLAGAGEALAQQVMAEAGSALGAALATMAMILNIDLFVIGGSVAKSGDVLLEPTRRALPHHAYRSVGCSVRVMATELGDDGPILGCAWLARQALTQVSQAESGTGPHHLLRSERAHLENVEGVVFDIQRFSVHDGPGIRTNVFLKGCPLRCPWCANPESQRLHAELMLSAQHCMNCQLFEEVCSVHWGADGWTQTTLEKYGERVAQCPTGAVRWVGVRRTAGDIIQEVLRDGPFYGSDGGLTLTGGEPTFQPRLAEALLRLAKDYQLSTAMETTGHTRWKILERLLPYVDHLLFDLKHLDPDVHRTFTGVDNLLILSNLRRLISLKSPLSIRMPLIPGFNATPESVGAVADFVLDQDGLAKNLCLLPYHTLGRTKYKALGRDYPWAAYERLADEQVEQLAQVVRARGMQVSIGG